MTGWGLGGGTPEWRKPACDLIEATKEVIREGREIMQKREGEKTTVKLSEKGMRNHTINYLP